MAKPRAKAIVKAPGSVEEASRKKGKVKAAEKMAPNRYTGRLPTKSEARPKAGIVMSSIAATINMKLRDDTTQEVFWVKNFVLTIVEMSGYQDLTMEGRFYHPDYGYVAITTPTAFRFTGSNEYPYPGVMVATGSNGSTATLTSLSTTSYQIDIDEDGDTVSDRTTTGNWNGV